MSDHQSSLINGHAAESHPVKQVEVTLRLMLSLSEELAAQSDGVKLQTIDLRLLSHKIADRCGQALSEVLAQKEQD